MPCGSDTSLLPARSSWDQAEDGQEPPSQWHNWWKDENGKCKYEDRVVPLRRALYRHPDSRGFGESTARSRCASAASCRLVSHGKEVMCFWNPKELMILTIYVGAFKMAGPKDTMARDWKTFGRKG